MSKILPGKVGAVAIGRNEGERLRRCLESLLAEPSMVKVVYVDSKSSDGSAEMAREMGVEVVDLDLSQKFTAARARNSGFRRLLQLHPDIEFIQFVDGDCELQKGWLDAALAQLVEQRTVSVVCGRRRERYPEYSLYNKLCDLEWDTPIGEAAACGGDALIRTQALVAVNGYREDLIAGEEPEMCFRMRQLGYRVMRLDQEMTLHDANISTPAQWFQRTKRSGHAFAEHAALHGFTDERLGVRQTVSNAIWGIGVPGVTCAVALSMGPLVATAMGAAAFGYLYKKSYSQAKKRRTDAEAKLEALGWVAGKVPEALGALKYLSNRVRGQQSRIMEYK